ncbi:Quinone oxidoreductase-like protein-like protein [Lachnellula subtilissima]|uniref:Quinone oxidoreductase-like protein-like protein n=1 Tax=Lachnellula subtilissima TaxID=602034 RepID=A0A8H8RV63_9HELO|nr:Quinone oxidoreductase-like protein-like protein [Lachnellula subtilissima]
MHAIQLSSIVEGPSQLTASHVPDPIPMSNEYLVNVYACGMNFFDLLQIRGKYQNQPTLPWIAGSEFSGVIVSVPEDRRFNKFNKGDRVFGAEQGAFATKISVPETQLQKIPNGWSFQDAAALYLTGPTSVAGLTLRANVQKGMTIDPIVGFVDTLLDDWVLIHGAAGGVGLSAIQVAKAHGAHVIATATGSSNIQICKSYGADHVIDYLNFPKWDEEAMKISGNHGIDVVWDTVGLVSQSLKCVAFSGRIVVVGFVGGNIESIKANRVLLKNISIVGLHWGAYTKHEPDTIPKIWDRLFEIIADKKFRSIVYQPQDTVELEGLSTVGHALNLLQERASWGKVVVNLSAEITANL